MAIKFKTKDSGQQPAPAIVANKKARTISLIAYPYFDHDSSIKVADVIQNQAGGTCAPDFLASKLGYSSLKSGTYLTRVAAVRMFGYIITSQGNFVVTERGRTILSPVMPEDSINAKAEGFLSVPLFARVYTEFRGRTLPPDVGLRNLFGNTYGIVPDRVPQAVRVFQNSAEQCGFFHAGKDRLIRPQVSTSAAIDVLAAEQAHKPEEASQLTERRPSGGGSSGGSGGDGGGIHTALVGLLRELPGPGGSWTESQQQDFITAFTGLVKFIFPARKGEAQ